MLTKKIFVPILTLLSLGMGGVYADSNAVVFPPAGNNSNYVFPPQTQGNPAQMRVPSYSFGQINKQVPPSNINRFIPNQQPQMYGNYPARGAMVPYAMPNYQNRTYSQNNNRFPFGGNNMMPFGNNNNLNPFSGNSFGMPSNPMNNMFGNNNSMPFFGNSNNSSMPFFGNTRKSNRKKAWGTERNIWPDFYTDFTDEAWDTVTSGPRDLGKMPGGWRFPHISTPDPVTVSDAITNQFPPIMEEGGNMMDFSDWGVFD